MSSWVQNCAAFALLVAVGPGSAGCGDDSDVTSGGAGGGSADASSSGVVIVGSSSGASPSTSMSSAGSGEGGDASATSASGDGDGDGDGGSDGGGSSEGGAGAGGGDAGGGEPIEPCPDFANEVTEITYGPGAGFGQEYFPDIVFGGPRGFGDMSGSLHVLTLGNGGSITLGFTDRRIVDGEGPDFIVFENAFYAGGDPDAPYAELGTVEVSADGETWETFPCTALEAPYGACAGWHPVYANVSDNEIDPLDPDVAGGDAFDLADVGLEEARYVRIVDRADQGGVAGMLDLDAVAIVHGTCDAE